MAVKERTQDFYQSIKMDYLALMSETKGGVPVYSQEYMFSVLAKKYFRSPRTIENIVFSRVAQ